MPPQRQPHLPGGLPLGLSLSSPPPSLLARQGRIVFVDNAKGSFFRHDSRQVRATHPSSRHFACDSEGLPLRVFSH